MGCGDIDLDLDLLDLLDRSYAIGSSSLSSIQSPNGIEEAAFWKSIHEGDAE
jgi:hypothetical protein